MMDAPSLDWLTPDIIQELIFDNMEEDDCEISSISQTCSKDTNVTAESVENLMASVSKDVHLSDNGNEIIESWMAEYKKSFNQEAIIAKIPKVICSAENLFVERVGGTAAANLLVNIVEKIVAVDEPRELSTAEITDIENSTLQYLGGAAIKILLKKFPKCSTINKICGKTPQGSLIELMEKRVGCLMCPSEEYMFFIQHIYLKFSYEASRKPTEIRFNKVSEEVIQSQYYRNFIKSLEPENEDVLFEEMTEEMVTYGVRLIVRMLSYSFAKKLFSRLHNKSTAFSAGLRGDLKRQLEESPE